MIQHCTCTTPNGYTAAPGRPGWWVHGACGKPAKTYLDAMEERGLAWEPRPRVQRVVRRVPR